MESVNPSEQKNQIPRKHLELKALWSMVKNSVKFGTTYNVFM